MRVLLYSHYFAPSIGGVEAFTEMLARYLNENGCEVLVVTATPGEADPRLPHTLRQPSGAALHAAVRGADVVATVGFHARLTALAQLTGTPLIWTHHNHDTACPKNLGYRAREDRFCDWGAQCTGCLREDRSAREAAIQQASLVVRRAAFGRVHHVSAAAIVRDRLLQPRGVVIPNGVELDRFKPLDVPVDRDRVLFVGRLVYEKGVHTLLSALLTCRENGVELGLTVCGDGPERPSLEAFAREHALDVEFAGAVARAELPARINGVLAVCNPQLWDWVLGISGIEVMACGKPLVSTRPTHPAEIPEGVALVHERGDSEGLARCLMQLRGSPEMSRQVSENARRFALKAHGMAVIGRAYLDEIQRVYREAA